MIKKRNTLKILLKNKLLIINDNFDRRITYEE